MGSVLHIRHSHPNQPKGNCVIKGSQQWIALSWRITPPSLFGSAAALSTLGSTFCFRMYIKWQGTLMTAQINRMITWNCSRLHYTLRRFYISSCLLWGYTAPFSWEISVPGDLQINDLRGWVPEEWGGGECSMEILSLKGSLKGSFWEKFSLCMWGHLHCLPTK